MAEDDPKGIRDKPDTEAMRFMAEQMRSCIGGKRGARLTDGALTHGAEIIDIAANWLDDLHALVKAQGDG